MKTLRNDYCIRMFTSNDNIRPALQIIQNDNGFIYATDARVLAKVPEDVFVKKYKHHDNFPNAETILTKHESLEKKTFTVDKLFHDLMTIEVCFKPKLIGCPKCSGEGKVHCDCCDYVNPCKECKGEGEVDGPELELSGDSNCKVFNRTYRLSSIDKVIRTAIILGVDKIEISNGKAPSSIFTVGDFTILVMITHEQ